MDVEHRSRPSSEGPKDEDVKTWKVFKNFKILNNDMVLRNSATSVHTAHVLNGFPCIDNNPMWQAACGESFPLERGFLVEMASSEKLIHLWSEGLPSHLRKVMWSIAIGNDQLVTHELFNHLRHNLMTVTSVFVPSAFHQHMAAFHEELPCAFQWDEEMLNNPPGFASCRTVDYCGSSSRFKTSPMTRGDSTTSEANERKHKGGRHSDKGLRLIQENDRGNSEMQATLTPPLTSKGLAASTGKEVAGSRLSPSTHPRSNRTPVDALLGTTEQRNYMIGCLSSSKSTQLSEPATILEALHHVIECYVLHRPDVGYANGMCQLTTMLLCYLSPFEAFRCLVNIVHNGHFFDLYTLRRSKIRMRLDLWDKVGVWNSLFDNFYRYFWNSYQECTTI
eukprot:GHVL01038875.1.p1 GENE.GHVL01038875.1~~GHVL01038875.1.p1  ORF type:complete len:392 (-),score=51.21 GHVL01038875.1:616-1791(-)